MVLLSALPSLPKEGPHIFRHNSLDNLFLNVHSSDMSYSTAEVAKAIGVSKKTLLRWLWDGKLKEPKRVNIGTVDNRIWSEVDVKRAKDFKEENYRKRS